MARVLIRLSLLDKNGRAVVEFPILSHFVLAEMVGTTCPRVNLFMNRFRKKDFISYDWGLEVPRPLLLSLQEEDGDSKYYCCRK